MRNEQPLGNLEEHMTQDARPSGASIRERVFGGANVQRPAQPDPVLAPFFETAIEHVWGGVWNRPGLELKYRSLVGAYAGFSAAHEALDVLSEIVTQEGLRNPR